MSKNLNKQYGSVVSAMEAAETFRCRKMSTKLGRSELWRVNDVANYLKQSKGHIYNLVSRKAIPFFKKGKLLYFIPSEIENWVLGG